MHAWRLISSTLHKKNTATKTAFIFSRTPSSSLTLRSVQTLAHGLPPRQPPRPLNQARPSSFTSTLPQRTLNRAMDPGVIAVIGTTGVGKSNLSIQLAKELSGEVVNADTLQVYKGLDIITNKMPIEEREGVVHHLMDFLPMDQEYSVLDFKADALELVRNKEKTRRLTGGADRTLDFWRDCNSLSVTSESSVGKNEVGTNQRGAFLLLKHRSKRSTSENIYRWWWVEPITMYSHFSGGIHFWTRKKMLDDSFPTTKSRNQRKRLERTRRS